MGRILQSYRVKNIKIQQPSGQCDPNHRNGCCIAGISAAKFSIHPLEISNPNLKPRQVVTTIQCKPVCNSKIVFYQNLGEALVVRATLTFCLTKNNDKP